MWNRKTTYSNSRSGTNGVLKVEHEQSLIRNFLLAGSTVDTILVWVRYIYLCLRLPLCSFYRRAVLLHILPRCEIEGAATESCIGIWLREASSTIRQMKEAGDLSTWLSRNRRLPTAFPTSVELEVWTHAADFLRSLSLLRYINNAIGTNYITSR